MVNDVSLHLYEGGVVGGESLRGSKATVEFEDFCSAPLRGAVKNDTDTGELLKTTFRQICQVLIVSAQ